MKLSKTEFYSTLDILKSEDIDDRHVALICMDKLDLTYNLVYLIILFNEGKADLIEWKLNAPITVNRLEQEGISLNTMVGDYDIAEIINKYIIEDKDILEVFIKTVYKRLNQKLSISFSRIKSIDTEITINYDE